MRIQLDRIGDEPFRWQETRQFPSETLERSEVVHLGEIAWQGVITSSGTGYLFQGNLEYEQTLTCQRCLGTTSKPVKARVELLLVSGGAEPTEGEFELEEEDLDMLYVNEGVVDTEPILLEQLQLNVPMRALCREECAGLCPVCGADRNLQECRCAEQTTDPRWSVLQDLRDQEE
jgi:uncharacterized protein